MFSKVGFIRCIHVGSSSPVSIPGRARAEGGGGGWYG